MARFSTLAAALASTACIVGHATPAHAQPRQFNVPAGPLKNALDAYVTQSGQQLIYKADELGSASSNGASGNLEPNEALNRILKGSGYKSMTDASGASAIVRGTVGNAGGAAETAASSGDGATPNSEKGIAEILVVGSRTLDADVRRTENDIKPYVVISKDQIQKSGVTNIEELLRTRLTMNYEQRTNDQSSSFQGTRSQVALRGLDASQTLILIDGRRASGGIGALTGTEFQPDLNGIPVNAIDRIEILPATASGIYGGSATGGVVNVILRRDYKGLEGTVRYDDSFEGGGGHRNLNLSGGVSFNRDKTSVMFSASIDTFAELLNRDRPLFEKYQARAILNSQRLDPDFFQFSPPLGATPNIVSAATSDPNYPACSTPANPFCISVPNLTFKPEFGGGSLGSPITSVPVGFSGTLENDPSVFAANAGSYNLALADTNQARGAASSLLNNPSRQALDITLRHRFNDNLEGFVSLSGSRTESRFRENAANNVFFVGASAPNNPFEQDLFVSVPFKLPGGDSQKVTTTTARMISGVKANIGSGWKASLEYVLDRAGYKASWHPFSLSSAAFDDIASGVFDVLQTPPPGGFDFSKYLVIGDSVPKTHATLHNVSLRLGGPVLQLPAGSVNVTSLIEYRRQSFSPFSVVSPSSAELKYTAQSSSVKSSYAEASIPLISPKMRVPVIHSLDVEVAARYDAYKNEGGQLIFSPSTPVDSPPHSSFRTVNPTIGMRFRPVENIAVRASFGTGFFPPPLNTINPNPPIFVDSFTGVVDPARGNEPVTNFTLITGGNPNLKPEKSKTWSAGVILTPVAGFRLSVDWTKIEKRNNIGSLDFGQTVVNQSEFLPNVIIRSTDPATFGPFGVGPIIEYNTGLINILSARSKSLDFSASYSTSALPIGAFDFSVKATRFIQNERQIVALAPATEFAGTTAAPKWQANGYATWTSGPISATWFVQFLGRGWLTPDHVFSVAQASDHINSATYHDLALEYRFKDQRLIAIHDGEFRLGIKNVFAREPRFFLGSFDPWVSPLGRVFYVSLTNRL